MTDVASELSLSRIKTLLESPCETASLDFKETLDLAHDRDRVEFAKDVLAMANTGGGDIVVGVEDGTRQRLGISEEISAALRDAKTINDKLKRYCGGFVKILVALHEIADPVGGTVRFALIRVPRAAGPIPAQDDGVYPDPSNPTKQKWVFRRGDIYVRKGDESVKVEIPEDLHLSLPSSELEIGTATTLIEEFMQQLEKFASRSLPPLPPSEAQGEVSGQSLVDAVFVDRDVLLLGPSGSGKTLHLKHAGLAAAGHKELPLIAIGGRYKGEDLLGYLAHSIGPFSTVGSDTLFRAASIAGWRVVVMFDGLNECAAYIEDLARGIQALRLRFPSTRFLFTSQTDLLASLSLEYERIFISPLTPTQKRLIFRYHANITPTMEVDHLCQGFSNGYDLAIAGRCYDSNDSMFTRVGLYDRYTRDSLPRESSSVLLALLRAISESMGRELTNFWPLDDFERYGEEFLIAQRAGLGPLDQLKSSRLITLAEDSFSFEHELLLDYFRAEQLRREFPSPDQLMIELAKPRNQSLVQFLLPRYKEADSVRSLFRSVLQPEILRGVLLGRCGDLARQTLLADCGELFSAAASDVSGVTISYDEEPVPGKLSLPWLELSGPRQWTPYELLLCDVIAMSLDDRDIQNRFLELLDVTQWALRNKAQEAANQSGVSFNNNWARIVGQLAMFSSQQLPFFRIVANHREGLMHAYRQASFALRDELLTRINRDATDYFSLSILLDGLTYCRPSGPQIDATMYIHVANLAWQSRIYHLRLNVLHLLHSIRHYLQGDEHREKLEAFRDFLGPLKTGNLLLSSSLVETQVAYGAVEIDVSVEEIVYDMETVIAESSIRNEQNAAPCDRAYALLSNIFEEIYQGAYDEAYESLSSDDKVALLNLAAQAKGGFSTGWILTSLLRFAKECSLPIFQKYASCIEADSMSPQESAGLYAIGVAGCAQFMDEAPEYTGPDTSEHRAWHLAGQILFWLQHNKRCNSLDVDRIDRLWLRLTSEEPLAAADALYGIHGGVFLMDAEQQRDFDLASRCPDAARALFEDSLKNRASLTSMYRWGGSRDESLVKFVIEVLGRIGDRGTIPVLREVSDDPHLGALAIAAIHKIRKSRGDSSNAS